MKNTFLKTNYVLAAAITGFVIGCLFVRLYCYFTSINKEELVSPLKGVESLVVKPVYANEIKKEDTRWYRLYKKVRWYESNNGTKGLAVTCKSKGKVNEIGYLPYKGFCFNSISEQELTFANWINNRHNKNGWTDGQLLCFYNTGMLMKTCAYSEGRLGEAN